MVMASVKPVDTPERHASRHLNTLCLSDTADVGSGPGYLKRSDFEATSRLIAPFYESQNFAVLAADTELQTQIAQTLGRVYVSDTRTGFCLTQNGHVGRVSHEAKVGDRICFFQGVDIPFTVRDTGTCPEEVLIIDHCFVEGLMNGEFWRQTPSAVEEICLV